MWLDPQLAADLVAFTEEIPNEKLHFFCSVTKQTRFSIVGNLTWLKFGRRKC